MIPKQAIRYENSYPIQDNRHSNKQQIVINHDSEENNDSADNGGNLHADVELHQPAITRPRKPIVLEKEHRAGYNIQNTHPKSTPTKPQVIIQPAKPIVIEQEHRAGYKIEESGESGKGSDDTGKGHAGSVSKHLYEIYVTHDTGKSNGGGGGDSKGSDNDGGDGDDGDDGKGKSENLVLEQPQQQLNSKVDDVDNGAYKVNINYGKKKGLKKAGKNSNRKRKGSIKKKKIIKPHKYEVEEYVDNEEEKKQPIVAGKESSPQHHRDSDDYSNGQQFVFASEADSDAYYW